MEKQFVINTTGTEVTVADLELIATEAALADDKVFAALLKLFPYPTATQVNGSYVYKGVLPKRVAGFEQCIAVDAGTANGTLKIGPFRIFLGTQTAASSDPKANLDDIRSTLYVGAAATSGVTDITLTANAIGNPRWDLIYAKVTFDNNDTSVTRYIKDATTKVVTASAVTVTKNLKVELFSQAGTASATPVPPGPPTDSGNVYYVPLCYVRIPASWTPGTINSGEILECYSPVRVDSETGGVSAGPANKHYDSGTNGAGGSMITSAVLQNFCTTGIRPGYVLSPSMAGLECRFLLIDVEGADTGWNIGTSGTDTLLDDTIDWRYRYFWWQARREFGLGGTTFYFATGNTESNGGGGGTAIVPTAAKVGSDLVGFGQSHYADGASTGGAAGTNSYGTTLPNGSARVVYFDNGASPGTSYFDVFVKSDGKLYCRVTNGGTVWDGKFFIVLWATGQARVSTSAYAMT